MPLLSWRAEVGAIQIRDVFLQGADVSGGTTAEEWRMTVRGRALLTEA